MDVLRAQQPAGLHILGAALDIRLLAQPPALMELVRRRRERPFGWAIGRANGHDRNTLPAGRQTVHQPAAGEGNVVEVRREEHHHQRIYTGVPSGAQR